ncbi:hypothetical protein HID58_030994 [Brassica napus]|uniref:Uncharacterized protein n=1 Tax=Brassica napus TaxID=3708 RepID=A0ABQ8CHN1_BRANA|nr:hypothetical protein HID58_030994 [Brassica napus]
MVPVHLPPCCGRDLIIPQILGFLALKSGLTITHRKAKVSLLGTGQKINHLVNTHSGLTLTLTSWFGMAPSHIGQVGDRLGAFCEVIAFRLVMDASGQFRQYNKLAKMVMWYLPWDAPKERCDGYG